MFVLIYSPLSVLSFFLEVTFYLCFLISYQVHTLLKGLEKIAASADIPMLVCGDFNSVPGRFVLFAGIIIAGVFKFVLFLLLD